MKKYWFGLSICMALAGMLAGCSHFSGSEHTLHVGNSHSFVGSDARARHSGTSPKAESSEPVFRAIQGVMDHYAPDSHLAIFNIGIQRHGQGVVLSGEVSEAAAKVECVKAIERMGFKVADRITVLPEDTLGKQVWGLSCLSVANGREAPDHKAEMGTQILMGHPVRVWKGATNWFLVQSSDGYLTWLEKGTFVRCAREQVNSWNRASLLIVTAFEDRVLERPQSDSESVSDVVMGDLVKKSGTEGDWFQIQLPDGRTGVLPKQSAEDYDAWKQSRRAGPENIERTARWFLGRPYLWGGNSPKGLDCSGFTKMVFFLNGIELNRNASEQAQQGTPVPVDAELSQLKKGDLLCFGSRSRRDRGEWVSHVGIYLGDKLFIQSSQRVRISSFDPGSPIYDERHSRMQLHVRRLLKD